MAPIFLMASRKRRERKRITCVFAVCKCYIHIIHTWMNGFCSLGYDWCAGFNRCTESKQKSEYILFHSFYFCFGDCMLFFMNYLFPSLFDTRCSCVKYSKIRDHHHFISSLQSFCTWMSQLNGFLVSVLALMNIAIFKILYHTIF